MKKRLNRQQKCTILKRARQFFFEAMLCGYADGEKPKTCRVEVQETKWQKTVTAYSGPFKMIDEWKVTSYSDRSSGTTTIFFFDMPIWWMSYSGSYKKEAIPVLKKALARAYRKGKFIGGRGPRRMSFCQGKRLYIYVNSKEAGRQTFHWFSGVEIILRSRSLTTPYERMGMHRYQGMSLI